MQSSSLQVDAYALLLLHEDTFATGAACGAVPEVGQLEASIATLKEEINTRKAAVAGKEALLANHNPPIFQAVQVCPLRDLLLQYMPTQPAAFSILLHDRCRLLTVCDTRTSPACMTADAQQHFCC